MVSRRGFGRAVIGIGISVVALFLVIRSVDLAATWDALTSAQPQWIAAMLLFMVLDITLRALRWRVLLRPVADVPFSMTLPANLVGYLANNILPARLGELVRTHDLGERSGVPRSTILGTIVVERVVDTVVLVAIASLAILVLSVRGIVASAVLVGLAVCALLVVAIAVGIAAHRLPGADRVLAFLQRWPRVVEMLARLREGLTIATKAGTVGRALVLTLAAWGCTILAFTAGAQAVGIQPTMGQAALLAAGSNLATAIPAAPGYVGTFELAAVTIGASIGIGRSDALAMTVLVHGFSLLLTSIGGAIAFALGPRRRHAKAVHAARDAELAAAASARDEAAAARANRA
ncbi:MAG TPA: lysylphosphatidylglycerol synthase transmembrane domain-containing protein [Candidatus Limnocylindrales bacterium]|jgi:uncharacterized protein (TIRG00374 family)|nr:lysylphosphatidylglycerol synthase transmembrane domain-containing protein [Candidatus Limnocylindrales bacterium]